MALLNGNYIAMGSDAEHKNEQDTAIATLAYRLCRQHQAGTNFRSSGASD